MPPNAGSENRGTLISQTATQIAPMATVRRLPKASSFCASGVFSSSAFAATTPAWILPISVRPPVAVTTASARPLETTVLANTMHVFC